MQFKLHVNVFYGRTALTRLIRPLAHIHRAQWTDEITPHGKRCKHSKIRKENGRKRRDNKCGRQKAKMEAGTALPLFNFAFDAVFTKPQLHELSASIPIFNNIKNIGRHDWTRTNDPYHVKHFFPTIDIRLILRSLMKTSYQEFTYSIINYIFLRNRCGRFVGTRSTGCVRIFV